MSFRKHITLKKILLGVLLSVLLIPTFQQLFQVFEVKPLLGSYTLKEKPVFTKDGWFDASYQNELQEYTEDHIGFRNIFVRLYNQMAYTFHNHARANGIIIGKENYLFGDLYIKAHLGRDFIGREAIEEKIQKLKKIQDTLASKNIDIVVVLAPGKGSYFSEYIPDSYSPDSITTTNYEVYRSQMKTEKVNFIDLKKWFLEMKDTSSYPLFPKTGIHWSKYGEVLAADSMVGYIEKLRNIKMPHIEITGINISSRARDTDDDIEKGMNLLFDIPDLDMAYPNFRFVRDSNTIETKVLSVADSYYWGLFNWGISSQLFNNGQFWYYNQQIHPSEGDGPKNVAEIDIIKEVEKNDVILLISTDSNLYKFAFGFIDQLYDAYFNSGTIQNSEELP